MTNEEIIEKIRTTLADEFEIDVEQIQPDAPLMQTLELDSLDLVDMVVLKMCIRDSYYYLFLAYDSLDVPYNTRVVRSKSITGPYVGIDGKDVTAGADALPIVTHPRCV